MISQAVESGLVRWDDPYDTRTYQILQAAIKKGKMGIPSVPRTSPRKPRISSRDVVNESSAVDRS